jgi:class 3 adenylate cyclase/tetratricopeptide (TPR) repeat protein
MSAGVHSGAYQAFLVGSSHREYILAGPAATTVVAMEAAASSGQILVSPETAARLPAGFLSRPCGPGILLARAPAKVYPPPAEQPLAVGDDLVSRCLSTEIRAHIRAGSAAPEHRTATVAFIQFGELDEMIVESGPAAAADALHELVAVVQEAADACEVCVLGSDIAAGGGKLLLSAGTPRSLGDDEERMLLTVRRILDAGARLPVRIGVNRGQLFAGEIGPYYRRTYTTMGDAVNLAARLMSSAPWGEAYLTAPVLSRSATRFEATALEPFHVKGKSKPVQAWSLGAAQRTQSTILAPKRLPLIGRDRELRAIRQAVALAREGRGALVEIVGETGSGKSRLLAEAADIASGMRVVHSTCEAFTQGMPYVSWRDPLRQLLGLTWEDRDELVIDRLGQELIASAPELLAWLPLLAIAFGATAPPTREVEELSSDSRTEKLHEVVLRFLAPALAHPTIVMIEHVHLIDQASAALLHALASRLGSTSWIVLVTRRDLADGFTAGEGAVEIELGPLSREDALALAEATAESIRLPPHVVELAVERSGGSPEFLLDLLVAAASGSGTLPDSIDAAARARIDALHPADRALISRASVLGLKFHAGRLRDVLDADAPAVEETTWRRLSSVFARDPDGHIRFKRPALRDVAYHGLPFRVRRQLHARAAAALERDKGHDVDADPAVLSLHYLLAGDNHRAWLHAQEGAERAAARFAHGDAARLYRRAIEAGRHHGATESQLASCWEALGATLHRTGELKAAAQAVTFARQLSTGDPIAQGRLFYQHTRIAEHAARLTTAVRWAHRGLRQLDGLPDRDAVIWRARIIGRLAFYRLRQGRLNEAERLCRQAIEQATKVGELEAEAYASWVLDVVLCECARHGEMGHSERALEIYAQLGDLEEQGNVLNNLAVFAYRRSRWNQALELFTSAADCRARAGIHRGVAASEINIGELMLLRGAYDQAARHMRRARRLWESTGERAGTAYAAALLGRLAVLARRDPAGLELIREGAAQLRSLGEQGYAEFAEALLAEAEAFAGDPQKALGLAHELLPTAGPMRPVLHRVAAIAQARMGYSGVDEELQRAVAAARDYDAQYDLAAALDLCQRFSGPDPERADERDAILSRLGIERLPEPPLGLEPLAQLAAAG